jgi:hypothetical protein
VEIYTIGFTQTTAEHFFGRLKVFVKDRAELGAYPS